MTWRSIKSAISLFCCLTLLTGLFYPAFMTYLAQGLFPWQAHGSLLEEQGAYVGSKLIGQYFDDPRYFWGRASATPDYPYNASYSNGSNLSQSNPSFLAAIAARAKRLETYQSSHNDFIPLDLLTSSASGLDPHISPHAAYYQVARIAAARNIHEQTIRALIEASTEQRTWRILGEPRVNVLDLNIALDHIRPLSNLAGSNNLRKETSS